jgi:hypothetical protein
VIAWGASCEIGRSAWLVDIASFLALVAVISARTSAFGLMRPNVPPGHE